jgi:hypothetical protein
MKPGKKGILSYELTAKFAKITVPIVDCGETACKGVKYYYMISK